MRYAAALFVVLLGCSIAAPAQAFRERTVAGWEISINDNDVCVMGSKYRVENGAQGFFVFGIVDQNNTLQMAYSRSDFALPKGSIFDIRFRVDSGEWYETKAEIKSESLFRFGHAIEPKLIRSLMSGNKLFIDTGKMNLSLTLQGTAQAFPVLIECALESEPKQVNPFSGVGSKQTNPF